MVAEKKGARLHRRSNLNPRSLHGVSGSGRVEMPLWEGTRERLPSNGCIESELLRSRLTGTGVPFASDTALTSLGSHPQISS